MSALSLVGFLALLAQAQSPAAPLRILVLQGEDAVNIVQQKTAVRPLVEVRDHNNLPVPGATVTFTIGGGQPAAFAGGAPTLSVTTNAAGQAAATGFNATGAGAVRIQVQAAHQGQLATAAITQTNFATAAAAAGAAATAGAAAGAGGGGGLSAVTIGIIAAGVAGGAVAATKVAGAGGGGGGEDSFDVYRGSFSGPFSFTTVCTGGPISPSTCVFARSMSGTMTIDLKTDLTSGRAFVDGSQTDQSVSGTQGCTLQAAPVTFTTPDTTATGGPSGLTFTSTRGGASLQTTVRFNGSHSGSTITGSLTVEMTSQTTTPAGDPCNGRGTATVPVTLQRP